MAARPYWQGQIRLALVSIPVEIYAATRSGPSISFKQIHEPSGKPIHYDKVVTGVGPVDPDEKMSAIDYVWVAALAGIIFGISYVADKYIYQPCRLPFAGNWAHHPELTVFAFLGLSFVTGLLINWVPWLQ